MSLIPTYPAALVYEAAFNAAPSATAVPPYWTDISARTTFPWNTTRGRQYELDTVPAGQWNTALDNRDGALDPSNAASPYYPNLVPYRGCRIRAVPGVNRLTVDQATAGAAGGYLGAIPPQMSVGNDFGYPVTIVPSGSAYEGATVYQAVLPSGAGAFATVVEVTGVPVVPGATYSFTAQARITAGTSTSTNVGLLWYSNSGVNLASVGGTAQTLTSGSSSWTALSVSGQAPAGATSVYLKVEIASGATSAQTAWQVDGLQFEQSATPTAFQTPQSLSANMLPQAIATGTASINPVADSPANWFTLDSGGTLAQAQFLAAAPTGHTTALAWTSTSGTTGNFHLYAGLAPTGASSTGPVADCMQVAAGTTYTFSVYLMRAASADTTIQVTAGLRWFDINGNILPVSAGTPVTVATGGWVRATCTAAAPAGAVWARPRIFISTPSSTTATNVIYSVGWQMEAAASASTWTDPGPTYYIYTGYVERWPQTWTMGGTFGQVQAIGVDAEALLAQDTLQPPFAEEVLAMNPNFFYQLDDPAGAGSCADSAANRPPAPIENSPFGPGSLTLGSSITSTTTPGTFIGTAGPVATFANNPSQNSPFQFAETFVNLAKTTTAPGPPATTSWTRMLAFRSAAVPGTSNDYNLWVVAPATWQSASNASYFFMSITATGFAWMGLRPPTATGFIYTGTTNLCDGDWHQMAIAYNASTLHHQFYVDGVLVASPTTAIAPSGCIADTLGCAINLGANQYSQGFVGDMAHAVEFPAALTQAQITNLYNSWRGASAGESSGARAQRLLTWLRYTGPASIAAGSTANMGPATDLTGATGLDALNAIALTENGNLYVSSGGVLTFTSRAARYNQNSPAMVFGEQAQWGEWPYESVSMDFDPTHLFNDIQVTQYSTSQVAEAIDATSESLYYQRLLQRTTNPGLYTEAVDAANYLLQQYKTARMRVSDLTLHPAATPGLFLACLQLEIGARIRVMRRPPQAPAITIDCFVESINWELDPTTGDVTVHLQCSPADLAAYWTLGALTTSLAASASQGATSISIQALPDAAVNALASSVSSTTQFTIDPGTAVAETVTLAAGGIPATNPGYSNAALTLASGLAHAHAAGAVVCEALPAAYTNPATWNVATVLGASAATFAAAASSGATSITVNALPDAKTNPATANWNTGDLLWLSPGVTGSFEGLNLLHPNLATAGEGALPLAAGSAGAAYAMASDLGTPVVTASATAFQGANVWALAVAASAATPKGLIYLQKLPVTAGKAFDASMYVRSATSGANPQVHISLTWLDANSNTLSSVTGPTSTLTGSPTASWTRKSTTGTAPTGSAWAQVALVLDVAAPGSAWSFQADGLQYEQNSSASTFQVCPQVLSVGTSVAGYTTVTVNLTTPLANAHAAGDIVCDALPPGTTSPLTVPVSARVTY